MRVPFVALAAAMLTVLPPSSAGAQTGQIQGRIEYAGRPVGGATVYLERLDGAEPSVRGGAPTITLDQVRLRFVPDVLVVGPGTEVSFLNSDPLMHNVFGLGGRGGDAFDLGTYPQGGTAGHVFRTEGVHTVLCHIHPEMVAYVIVVPDLEASTATDDDGSFVLNRLEAGRYRLAAWHPRWYRSRTTTVVELTAGENKRLSVTLNTVRGPTPEGG